MKDTLKKMFESYIESVGKTRFVFILIFGVMVSIILALEPLIFTEIIKRLELYFKGEDIEFSSIFIFIVYWGIFILFSIAIQFLYDYFFTLKPTLKSYSDMTIKYSKKIIDMNFGDYLSKKQGSLYKIMDKGCSDQEFFFYFFFRSFLRNISLIVSIIIILLYLDFFMGMVVISMLPFMIYIGYVFLIKVFPRQQEIDEKWYSVFGLIGNILSNFMLTKSLTIEKKFKSDIKSTLDIAMSEQMFLTKMWSLAYVYTSGLVMVSRLLVLGFGTYFVIKGTFSFAMLFLFFSYIGWIYFPLGELFQRGNEVSRQISSVKKLYDNFENLSLEELDNGESLKNIKGSIEFKDVNFSYIKGRVILKDLNLELNPGEKIAFVGDTGAGKSTIVNLILRFWDINSGQILIDSKDIKDISKKSLRSNIGVVTQDNSLFNMSIKDNLVFANKKAKKQDIEFALKKSESNFVFELKDGLDTIIGERGLKLSGGEKQRLSIARLFLKDPKILILDEATSALDNKTEKLVHKALDNLMKDRTSVIIAHRLSTIQNADRIYVLDKGKIVESGKYDELIEKKGKLYSLANPDKLVIS